MPGGVKGPSCSGTRRPEWIGQGGPAAPPWPFCLLSPSGSLFLFSPFQHFTACLSSRFLALRDTPQTGFRVSPS